MSTATLPATNGVGSAAPVQVDAATLEKVVVNGDLSKLSPAERLRWYQARCDAAGLDPRTQPFQYIVLQGRLTLYATKAATDQLIGLHRLTVSITDRRLDRDAGIYEVQCRVTFPDGRSVEDMGALSVAGLKGDALANALMKGVTKSKRRTVLSACGLGMLDETEVETIPDARPIEPPPPGEVNDSNVDALPKSQLPEGGNPRLDAEYATWQREMLAKVNGAWHDHWSAAFGADGVPNDVRDLINAHQLGNHMLKFLGATKENNHNHRMRRLAIEWDKDRQAFEAEAGAYCRKQWRKEQTRLLAKWAEQRLPQPEDESQEVDDDEAPRGREPGEEG